jgi:low temperature requirement protein LtrA
MVLGGPALFLAGHASFKFVVWRRVSWQRLGGVGGLTLLGILVPHASAVVLSACATGVVVAVAAADRIWPPPGPDGQAEAAD